MAGGMMVDLSAAFDMVDHALLLDKLELLGLDRQALQWVGSYLAGRAQCVCVDETVHSHSYIFFVFFYRFLVMQIHTK